MIDFLDGFGGWKMLNLKIRKQSAIAEIVQNPFADLSRKFRSDGLYHDDKLTEYITANKLDKTPKIKFQYSYDGEKHTGAYFFSYDYDGNSINSGMADFISTLSKRYPGKKFAIYHYKELTLPKDVVDEIERREGIRFYFDPFVMLFILASILTYAYVHSTFISNERAVR